MDELEERVKKELELEEEKRVKKQLELEEEKRNKKPLLKRMLITIGQVFLLTIGFLLWYACASFFAPSCNPYY